MSMDRYSKQLLFTPIGENGQEKLANSTVLVVGVGALGTVISNHLVRSGVGHVRLVDRDYVEYSNLQRQLLFDEEDVSETLPKAIAAQRKLMKINHDVIVDAVVGNADIHNIDELLQGVDVVMDGTDNFQTRFLLNDACFKHGIPFSYGGVVAARGMTALFVPGITPCYRCLTNEGYRSGATCDTAGVLAPIVDMIASYEVIEVMKYLTGNHGALRNTMKTIDIWQNRHFDMKLPKPKQNCPTCVNHTFPSLKQTATGEETVMCGRNTVQITCQQTFDLTIMANKLQKVCTIKQTPFLMKAVVNQKIHLVIFPDGRVLVQGTEDPVHARTIYDKYIGS